ncbi:MAG: 30S ribosomal protein S8e [Candidatus Micrarchaeota archaeon]|nr:30S ribosomal protein S8e [Candidatus Micrarchaeota archaeon]
MQQYHKPQTKKVSSGTGGAKRKNKDKKLIHMGGVFTATKVSKVEDKREKRTVGGKIKIKLKKAVFVNTRTKDGKMAKVKIIGVVESHNSEFVRQNIITKGAVLNTDIGKVKVTNRVGQDGSINGVAV